MPNRSAAYKFRHRLASLVVLAAGMMSLPALAADLDVTVTHIRSDRGQVMLALTNTAEDFAARRWLVGQTLPAKPGNVRFILPDLAAGEYAISVFHDENDNGKLDSNFFGVPTEGYGFSNNARGNFGPPDFAAARFGLPASSRLTIELGY